MKRFSQEKMIDLVHSLRKQSRITQADLAEKTGINRAMIGRIKNADYIPTVEQLEALGQALGFEVADLFEEKPKPAADPLPKRNIAVAGTGYVGLSLAVLLAQHNHVTAVDIVPEKVEKINNRISPIQDDYIEEYLVEKELDLTATLDGEAAYAQAEFVVIAAPTNYDSQTNHFDTSAVEDVIELVMRVNPEAMMVIKSTIPVGYTDSIREKYGTDRIIFSPEFLRESKALYDNLYPSRIIVGCDEGSEDGRPASSQHYCSRVRSNLISIPCSWGLPKRRP